MARAFSAVERREYVRAVIRITKHQGRLTTSDAMKKLGLSRDTVLKYFREAEATGEVVRHGRSGLFRDQRAVIDSKPIGWTDKEELRDVDVAGIGYLFKLDAAPGFDPRRQILLIQAPEVNV